MGKNLPDISIEFAGLKLHTPVLLSSGCCELSQKTLDLLPLDILGAVITKTITLDKQEGNAVPRTCEASSGLINSIGLQNEGLYHYIKKVLPGIMKFTDLPVISSIGGNSMEEYATLASHLEREKGVSALEVNISCPNVGEKLLFSRDVYMSYGVVKAVRESTDKPVIVKLSPDVADIKDIALAVADAGCDALTVGNTYPALAVDIATRRSKLAAGYGGLSGPAIKPLTMKRLREVFETVRLPLIASGGIMNSQDALEYIIAGATSVALGSLNFVNPGAARDIVVGIRNYLSDTGTSYRALIGSLRL